MKKTKLNSPRFSERENQIGKKKVPGSGIKKLFNYWVCMLNMKMIILLADVKGKNEKPEKSKEIAVKLTAKQKAEITAKTKQGIKALLLLPTAPYEILIPAPGLNGLNAAQLCNMLAPLFVSLNAIAAFSAVSPTVAFCETLYTALFPLSSIGRKISDSDMATRDTLVVQLRNNFSSTLKDAALLANGDKALYLLIGSPLKRKAVRSHSDLAACEFKLNLKKGRGKVGISCKDVPNAKGYTVWYGKGDFDADTWFSQSGSATQIVSANLVPGDYINFVMIAFKGNGAEGARANIQGCNIPFS